MFDQIVAAMTEYPYLVVGCVFLLCGLGLPLPEEIVLLAGGYFCHKFPDKASLHWMMVWCATAILAGDLLPFILGRVFGARLLRLRWMRYLITKQRLANFDRWFRRRGDMVILIARFLAGIRMVAFFTAGTMKMPWRRFLLLDGIGIVLMVPLLVWAGSSSANYIDKMITTVQKVERGILWSAIGGGIMIALWVWVWQRRRQQQRQGKPAEAFVQPQLPIQPTPECPPPRDGEPEAGTGDDGQRPASPSESTPSPVELRELTPPPEAPAADAPPPRTD
ncbi:MAG: DedA family protein [Planctomycetes bacterium]|jgi:membrane protein DedA with SNARE-associated domain|nr:DedA family protein [Planctomycetota bacterium]MCC7061858.1 DedA family protein [Planctomycetota bacterium]